MFNVYLNKLKICNSISCISGLKKKINKNIYPNQI